MPNRGSLSRYRHQLAHTMRGHARRHEADHAAAMQAATKLRAFFTDGYPRPDWERAATEKELAADMHLRLARAITAAADEYEAEIGRRS